MCPVLTKEEFEYQTRMGSTRDAVILGVGYARWQLHAVYEVNAYDNGPTFIHPAQKLTIEEDPSFYIDAMQDYILNTVSDGNSFWDLRTNTIQPLPSGSSLFVGFESNNQVEITTKTPKTIFEAGHFKEIYIHSTISMTLGDFLRKTSSKPTTSLRIDTNDELSRNNNVSIDHSYYNEKSRRAEEILETNNNSTDTEIPWEITLAGSLLTVEDVYNNFGHNHTTYKTTRNITKNIYKTNGAVRSARAAKFATTSKFVKRAGVAGTILNTGIAGYNISNDISNNRDVDGWDIADASVGGISLIGVGISALGIVSNPAGLGVLVIVGTGATIYSTCRLSYDLGREKGMKTWYGTNDNKWLE